MRGKEGKKIKLEEKKGKRKDERKRREKKKKWDVKKRKREDERKKREKDNMRGKGGKKRR